MAVVRDCTCHCTAGRIAETGDETIGDGARAAMALDYSDLAYVSPTVHVDHAVSHFKRAFERLCRRLVFDNPNHPRGDLCSVSWRSDIEVFRLKLSAQFDR